MLRKLLSPLARIFQSQSRWALCQGHKLAGCKTQLSADYRRGTGALCQACARGVRCDTCKQPVPLGLCRIEADDAVTCWRCLGSVPTPPQRTVRLTLVSGGAVDAVSVAVESEVRRAA